MDENEGFNYSWRGQFEYIKNFGRHAVNVMVGGELSSNKHKSYAQTNYGYMPERACRSWMCLWVRDRVRMLITR